MSDAIDQTVLPVRRPCFGGAVRRPTAQIDGGRARQLKAVLAEVQAGMGG